MRLNNGNGKKRKAAGNRLFPMENINIERSVYKRYAKGAKAKQVELCCPINYDPKYLKVVPKEIIEKDYGCGDPTNYVREGDTVLDLGSGGGKICYIASQIFGPKGKVIGVDFNPEMLALANKYRQEIGKRIGWNNVEFRWGRIQDLKTNLGVVESYLARKPLGSVDSYLEFEALSELICNKSPLIEDDSIDVIISNCVLNLVRSQDKKGLFKEMHRVLKKGGRIAISDIVSDEPVPQRLQNDPKLWSGCISGAFEETQFLKAFENAGFYGIQIDKRDEKPWQTIEGIEFRSVTVTAYKGKEGQCYERNQAVIYKGPWKQVEDDDNHILKRGIRTAVCDKTFQIYSKEPYQNDIIRINPRKDIPLSKAALFDCSRSGERDPKETKGLKYKGNTKTTSTCSDGGCC